MYVSMLCMYMPLFYAQHVVATPRARGCHELQSLGPAAQVAYLTLQPSPKNDHNAIDPCYGKRMNGLELLRSVTRNPDTPRLKLALDIARGLEYLHWRRLVHFDIKADNLMTDIRDAKRPIAKIGDLGLAKLKSSTYVSGNMRGTLPWMAPELFPTPADLRKQVRAANRRGLWI